IEIENQTGKTINAFYYYVDYLETPVDDNMGYFHAWYNHQITKAPEEGENEWSSLAPGAGTNPLGEKNYLILDTKGKGQFVGVNYYVNNPGPIWYGEGDDMFYIDGDTKPTLNGTGTEDYFNTSWCPKTAFCTPYYGYPRVNGTYGWMGRTHLYRFNIQDPVYFDKSLKFTIEHGHNNYLTLDLASVAYWYASKPTSLQPIPDKEHRKFMPENSVTDINRWRDAWRKAHGNGAQLWGNEQ
ncbi:MAG TPA: glycoside hydrolase family 172 protein, partial [Bacteroidales bacterium]|nr:glycoside hydrolase family 172 protein [Bacteroidales bacterium]